MLASLLYSVFGGEPWGPPNPRAADASMARRWVLSPRAGATSTRGGLPRERAGSPARGRGLSRGGTAGVLRPRRDRVGFHARDVRPFPRLGRRGSSCRDEIPGSDARDARRSDPASGRRALDRLPGGAPPPPRARRFRRRNRRALRVRPRLSRNAAAAGDPRRPRRGREARRLPLSGLRGFHAAGRTLLRRRRGTRLDRQERLPDGFRARLLPAARRDPDRSGSATRRSGGRTLWLLRALPGRLPDGCLPGARPSRRRTLPRLLDDRTPRDDPRRRQGEDRAARLRLRHLPGRLPLEQAAFSYGGGAIFRVPNEGERRADPPGVARDGTRTVAASLRRDRVEPGRAAGPSKECRGVRGSLRGSVEPSRARPRGRSLGAGPVRRLGLGSLAPGHARSPPPSRGSEKGSLEMDFQTGVFILLFLLSLAFSAFFAGAETALVSLGRIDLQRFREKGDKRGAIIRDLKSNRNRLLATILIGQNLFMSSASALATVVATAWLGENYGVPAAILFSTLTLFVFAEMTPKAIGPASQVAIPRP